MKPMPILAMRASEVLVALGWVARGRFTSGPNRNPIHRRI